MELIFCGLLRLINRSTFHIVFINWIKVCLRRISAIVSIRHFEVSMSGLFLIFVGIVSVSLLAQVSVNAVAIVNVKSGSGKANFTNLKLELSEPEADELEFDSEVATSFASSTSTSSQVLRIPVIFAN